MIPLSRVTVTDEMKRAILAVVDSGRFILGPETKAFELEMAAYLGVKHAVAVSQGTSAIQLALMAIGVRPGDEVLVPAMTAFPTIEGVMHAGAIPVFVDQDRYGCMDPDDAAARITSRTVGVVPVHLYGGVADLDRLLPLAERHGLWVMEDCCQAIGAMWGDRKVGSIGRAGALSFYPSKNLTVFGDGGMVTTNDDALAAAVRKLRDHGRADKYTHELVGFNLRFNDIQAAVGRRQLALIESFTERRRTIARRYAAGLSGVAGLTLPAERPNTRMVFHLYPLRVSDRATRDALAAHLKAAGIETGIHYPLPNHRQPAILERMLPPELPSSEAAGATLLSLPMFPGLGDTDVDEVIAAVRGFFAQC